MQPSEDDLNHPRQNKEPWFAVNLSWMLPGIGQIYAGQRLKGTAILVSFYLLMIVGCWLLIDAVGNSLVGIAILTFLFTAFPIINLFDAYTTVKNSNSSEFELERKQQKDAWLAVFLSVFIPGLGHAYLRKWIPCIFFLVAFGFVLLCSVVEKKLNLLPISWLLRLGLGLSCMYFAYVAIPGRKDRSRRKVLVLIAGLLSIPLVFSSGLAMAIRQLVAEARFIPAGSMLPTLQIDDRVIVNKLTYRFQNPERGDIVVFSPPEALQKEGYKEAFIKRIIGIPGDQVDVKGGKVYLNGKVLSEKYLDEPPRDEWSTTDKMSSGDHPIPWPANGRVPEGSYLVLGDNRNNSYDSHYWGFVPRANIIGKATKRFFPLNRIGSID